MKQIVIMLLLLINASGIAQSQQQRYEDSFTLLEGMLKDASQYSFKKAVFSVENAYLNGKLDMERMDMEISSLTILCNTLIENGLLTYSESDKKDMNKWAAAYRVMCDSISIVIQGEKYKHIPLRYDFNDVFGNQDIFNMFVSKLLYTRNGNCHSLPYLYKILCEEQGTTAHLALAPNHIYIKHQNKANGWYNTELTSGIFPTDAWLMASGFVHIDAIKNGVYMKALNNQESIALLMIDLANAYQKSFPENDGSFLLKCADTAVEAYPNFAKALIMRAEQHKKEVEKQSNSSAGIQLFEKLQTEYAHIHEIGYRFMPEEMYLNWLESLKTEREKYENKKMNTFNKQ